MDEGGWANYGIRIATNSFKLKEVELLQDVLCCILCILILTFFYKCKSKNKNEMKFFPLPSVAQRNFYLSSTASCACEYSTLQSKEATGEAIENLSII
jgi:hypothetical protein